MADDVPISILYQKLEKLLLVLAEGRVIFPSLKNHVDIAIKELKQILSFLHAENDNNNSSSSSSSHIPLQEAPRLQLLRILDYAETTIETFLLTTEQRRRKSTAINLLIKTLSVSFPIIPPWTQIQFSCKMKKLAQSFGDVSNQLFSDHHPAADKYQILDDPIFTQPPAALEKRQQWHQYDALVGREDAEKEMVARLTNDDENLCVISLVSEEALGKTALAWNVYNKLDIRQHFQCRAWLHVPIDFENKDLLLTILKQIPTCVLTDVELMSENELSAKLFQILMELRFLIVLDAVPSFDVWATLARPFADAANGSRVILTTRNSKIASDVDPWGHQLKLMCLSDEESWALFSRKLQVGRCRPENSTNYDTDTDQLKIFRREILRICRGLPPTIVLLGGLLSTIELSEWSGVIDYLSEHSPGLLTVATLSYHKLPCVLKPCFLYLTLFPAAYEIPTRRLLPMWIAEGFIQIPTTTAGVLEPEDMAKKYLEELVCRNMIDIVRLKKDGSPKTCRMPCFLYDIFLPKAKDIGFLHVHHCKSDCTFANSTNQSNIIRRLADQYVGVKSTSESHTQHLCSYVLFEVQKQGTSNREIGMLLDTIINRKKSRGFVLMKVLDLEGVYKPLLPEKLGQYLQNLRYIGLRWTGLDSCPMSIGDLPCLETLDLKYTNITTLPSSIWKAKNLRHVYMNEVSIEKPSPKESSVSNLQTLMGLLLGPKDPFEYGLNWFTSLRKLGVSCNPKSVEKTTKCISVLDNLQTLKLISKDRFGQPLDLELSPLKDHHSLSNLYLFGMIKDGIKNLPPNLTILTLSMSKLIEDPMPVLGKLPQLNILRLFAHSYAGSEMSCLSGHFPKLHVLKLWMLETLEQWAMEEGAMPQLLELEIRGCKKLTKSDGLEKLPALEELILTNMLPDFVADVRKRLVRDILLTNEWQPLSLACKFS